MADIKSLLGPTEYQQEQRRKRIAATSLDILKSEDRARAAQAATTLNAARTMGPGLDITARAASLRNTTTLPPSVPLRNPQVLDEIEASVQAQRETQFLEDHPQTARLMSDYQTAVAAHDDVETIGWFESLRNTISRRADAIWDGSWYGMKIKSQTELLDDARDAQMSLDQLVERRRQLALEDNQEGVRAGRNARNANDQAEGELNLADELTAQASGIWRWLTTRMLVSDETLAAAEKAITEDIAGDLRTRSFESQERETLWRTPAWRQEIERTLAAGQNDTFWGGLTNIAKVAKEHPGRFMQYMMEISAESSLSIGAGLAVGAATKNPTAAAAAMGAGSYATSQALYFEELVQSRGFDISTQEGIAALLKDPQVLADLQDDTKKYSIVVGLLDGISAGMAGKVLSENPVGEMFLQLAVQGMLGGGGEYLGRMAAGEPIDWVEVIMEGLAETVTAPLEMGGMAVSGARRKLGAVQDQKRRATLFNILAGKVQESNLHKRDRETFKNAIAEVTKNGPAESVHLDPDAVEQMFQSNDMDIKEFFDAVPEISYEDFIEARDNGSLYVIPTSVYAASIAGTEIGARFQDLVKLRPGDMSAAEVKQFQADLDRSQAELATNADKLQTVIGELNGPLADEMERLTSEIVMASGFAPDIAAKQAAPLVAAARVGAQRAGMTVAEYLRRYTLPAVRNADTVGVAPARPLLDPDRVLDAVHAEDGAADAVPGVAEIRSRLDDKGIDPTVASRDDIVAAVRELNDEGVLAVDMPIEDASRPATLDKPDDEELMQTATLRGGEEDMAQWGHTPGKPIKTRDLALLLEKRQRKLYGKINRRQRGPKTIEKMASWMADELEFELQTPDKSAVGWYGPKFQSALDKLGQLWAPMIDDTAAKASSIPGVETMEDARAFATALFAVSSNGTKVVQNVDNAITAILELEESGGELGTKATHRAAINEHMATMIRLTAEMGGVGMQAHLTREMTMAEVNKDIRKDGGTAKGGYPADMIVPYAARYLGPKLAAFYANLTGADGYLTMDLWWTRSINRYRGDVLPRVKGLKNEVDSKGKPIGLHRFKVLIGRPDLTDKQALNYATEYAEAYAKKNWKNGTEAEKAANTIYKAAFKELAEQPEGAADRRFMIDVARAARDELERRIGVRYSIADVQALLWYYEKRLYAEMGVRDSGDLSYEEAADQVVANRGGTASATTELFQGPIDPARNTIADNTILGPDGEPVMLYHGTNQSFTTFKDGRIFLTNKKSLATDHAIREGFGGARVIEANVALENPLEVQTDTDPDIHWLNNTMSIERRMREGGHDGVMIWNDAGVLMVIATANDQVTQFSPAADEFFQSNLPDRPVTVEDFSPENLRSLSSEDLLALFKRPGWYVVTAARTEYGPSTSEDNIARNMQLKAQLEEMGRDVVQMNGVYKGEPDGLSFLVIGPEEEAIRLGKEWGQESVLSNSGLTFTDGSDTPNVTFSGAVYGHAARYEDFYSRIDGRPPIDSWSLKLDFSEPADVTVDDGNGTSHYGARVEDGKMRLTHWSTERRDALDPAAAGTGNLPGPERKRGGPAKTFFGLHIGQQGGYQRENALLGDFRHEVLVDPREMYPWWQDPDGLKEKIDTSKPAEQQKSQYEQLIKDAGYKGYFVIGGPLGDTAILFGRAIADVVSVDTTDAKAVRSSSFVAWFGESVVANEDGSPRMVYHRTSSAFDAFRVDADGPSGPAIWFGDDPEQLPQGHNRKKEGGNIIPAYVRMERPLELDYFNLKEMQDRWANGSKEFPFLISDETRTRLKEADFDGIIAEDVYGMDTGNEYVVLDPEQVKSPFNRGSWDITDADILNQQNNGSIILPKDLTQQATIQLFQTANLSTMLHETGHFFLWQLQKQSNDGLKFAQEELTTVQDWWRKNAAAIAQEAGVDKAQVEEYLTVGTTGSGSVNRAIHRALHEQFARGFEAYAMEGKSPSNAMRALFEDFAAWLMSWYKHIKNLNVAIDDDIRGVFDRLLATEEELLDIAERDEINDAVAETAREMGLDEDSYRRLVALSQEARDEGRQLARKEMLATEKKVRSAEYQARLAEIDAEERERIINNPVHRAIQWLAYGRWLGEETAPEKLPIELRFDTELLIEEHGKEVLDKLPRGRRPVHVKDTLLSADEVAGWFGFDSGADLLDAMIKAPKLNDEVKAAVNTRAHEELGDIASDPDAIAEVVADAYHGEKRGQVIVAELRAINRISGRNKKMTSRQQASAIAKELIWKMPVREATQSSRYLAAERKHAEEATRQMAAGNLDAAFEAKRRQLIQHSMYTESRKVAELQGKAERLAGRLKRKGTRENLAPEYLGAIDDVLETYDFRKISGTEEVRRARLQAYVEMMKQAKRESELAIPDYVLNNARRIPYKTLTSSRLQGVYDTLRNIEHTARWKQKLRLAQEERKLQDVRDEIAGAFAANVKKGKINRAPTRKDALVSGLKGYINLVRNADTILRKIDGWADRGVMVRYFKEMIDDAGTKAKEMRDEATVKLDELFSVYSSAERRQMAVRKKWPGYEQALSKWDVISIALNTGNKGNLDRLTSRDSRQSFSRAELDALLDTLDKRDWDFVQATWDMIDTYWSQIAERERRMTGVVPEKVEAEPVQTKFGEYKGGYYPISYDPRFSAKVTEDRNADLMTSMMAGRFGKAQTKNGHTKERAGGGGGRTVQLGMHVLFGHLNNVIHDLAYGEAVNTTWRLLQDNDIKAKFEEFNMLEDHKALEWWVQDVAAGPAAGTHVMSTTLRRLKSGFTLSKLAFNMSTVAIQVTGLTQSMATIGSGYMMKGMSSYLFSANGRYQVAQQIKERSPFMQEREETFHKDAYDMARDVQLDPLRGVVGDAQRLMIQAGFFAMQKVQYYAVDVPTWIGAHTKGLDEGMTEDQAARYADRMVARAQASGLYADRTAVERGTFGATARQNELLRLFTALGSYMFAKYNVAEEVVGRTVRDVQDHNKNSLLAVLKGASDILLLFTIEAIMYNLVKGTLPGMGDDDDEGWAEFLAKETALSIASVFPGIRDMSSAVQGFSGGGAYSGVSETLGRAIASAGDLAIGEADIRDVRSGLEAAGILIPGVPSTAIWRLIDGVGLTGEDPSPLAVIMGR